ncbi:response regulator transcription factor [Altererythrobacter sp. GH1-8]|uniref:response regulator transcription factor n=1 Tax=Altererythrobacter sp. GH1-8 TaxID=3349333 RepID=UPI00374DEEB6
MQRIDTLLVVDTDHRRRAQLSFELSKQGFHVEPCEKILEAPTLGSGVTVILAFDDGLSLSHIAEHLEAQAMWAPVIAYAVEPEIEMVVHAVSEFAIGYLAWPVTPEKLARSLSRIEAKRSQISTYRRRELDARKRLQSLSPREKEVLSCIGNGLTSQQAADRLQISVRTVEQHRLNLMRKTRVKSTGEAVRLATQAGMQEGDERHRDAGLDAGSPLPGYPGGAVKNKNVN